MEIDATTRKLIDIAISLSCETDLNRLLDKIVYELRTLMHADGGSLYLREKDRLRFEIAQNDTLKRLKGADYPLFQPYELLINEDSIAGYVALTGTPLNIPQVYELAPDLPYRFDTSFDERNEYRTQSLLAVPLKDREGRIVGVLQLINAQDEAGRIVPFPDHRIDVVLALASQAAVAINNARLVETLEKLRLAEKKRHYYHLEAIFQSVKDAIITLDLNFHILAVNDAARTLCGLVPETAQGRDFLTAARDCGKACAEALKDFDRDKEHIREFHLECRRPHRPGQAVSVTRAPLRDHEEHCIGLVLVVRDLTPETSRVKDLSERYRPFQLIGRSAPMQQVYRLLDDLLPTDTTVLICGETGTGKELVATALHYGGPRAARPLVKVNCSALAETLLESELFGHVKGAFTGAHRDRAGRLQTAQGGTILLDEIGDVSLKTQAKLLRFLEDKCYERVGESITRKADVRILAATHRDLKKMVKEGLFRQDLYFRLKVFEITLPPLRERLEDLPLLLEHFRRQFNEIYKKHVEGFLPGVVELFRHYSWPGNVRELKHVVEHAFVQCRGAAITLDDLPPDFTAQESGGAPLSPRKSGLEPRELLEVLTRTAWNKARAARELGISRPTLYRLLAFHQLSEPRK